MRHNAQFTLATLVLVGLLSVISFWWIGMHQGDNHNCVAANVQATECRNATMTESALYHLNTLRSYTTTVLQTLSAWTVLLAISWLAAVMSTSGIQNLTRRFRRQEEPRALFPSGAYQRWLALLEHSPSTI